MTIRQLITITALLFAGTTNAQILDHPTQRKTDMTEWGITVQCAVYSTAAASSYASYVANERPNVQMIADVLQVQIVNMFLGLENFNQETQKLDNSLTVELLPEVVLAGLILGFNLGNNPTIEGIRTWTLQRQAESILHMSDQECHRRVKAFRDRELV